jgi:hypothetical protein
MSLSEGTQPTKKNKRTTRDSKSTSGKSRSLMNLVSDLRRSVIESRRVGVDALADNAREFINTVLDEQKSLSKEKSDSPLLNLREAIGNASRDNNNNLADVHEQMLDRFREEFDAPENTE